MKEKKFMLVIDDDIFTRKTLSALFSNDFEMYEAESGEQGLVFVRNPACKVDIILLDIHMQGMDGYEFLKRLSDLDLLERYPVVAITSDTNDDIEVKALDLGAIDLIQKPFVPKIIRRRVKNAVLNRELQTTQTEKAKLETQTYIQDHDMLTGIYTAQAFYRETEHMLSENPDTEYLLIRFNIEKFRVINEIFSKETADNLLLEMAGCFRTNIADFGTFGRIEADHFAVCFPSHCFDPVNIYNAVKKRFDSQRLRCNVVIDMGIYEIGSSNSATVMQMCDRAKLALNTINGNFEKNIAYYDDELRQKMLREQEIVGEMRHALNTNQFVIYLQPVYCVSDHSLYSAEALVRWIHPEKGVISPGDFIPIFERNGFITQLDFFVWEEVCKYQRARIDKGEETIPISVNVSRTSFYKSSLATEIFGLTVKYDIPTNLIKIEITESAYNDNPSQLLKTVGELQQHGFHILMDDFGSGYSSLNTLKDIPVDTLKIDMKFMSGIGTSDKAGSILTSVVRMAKWINLPVIAEGVETATQVDFLKSIGCDNIQGFYFSKPLPIPEFEKKISMPIHGTVNTEKSFDESEIGKLFDGNEFVNRLLNGSFGGIGFYEVDGDKVEVIRVNDAYYDILGYTPQTLAEVAKNIKDFVMPGDIDLFNKACEETRATQKNAIVTLRRFHRDGHLMHLLCNFRHFGGESNKPIYCITFEDITAQRMQEDTIYANNLYVESLFKTIGCGIMQSVFEKGELVLAHISDEAWRMCGFDSREEYIKYIGGNTLKLVHSDDVALVKKTLQDVSALSEQRSIEFRLRSMKNGYFWVKSTIVPMVLEDGSMSLQSTFFSIDEWKKINA